MLRVYPCFFFLSCAMSFSSYYFLSVRGTDFFARKKRGDLKKKTGAKTSTCLFSYSSFFLETLCNSKMLVQCSTPHFYKRRGERESLREVLVNNERKENRSGFLHLALHSLFDDVEKKRSSLRDELIRPDSSSRACECGLASIPDEHEPPVSATAAA